MINRVIAYTFFFYLLLALLLFFVGVNYVDFNANISIFFKNVSLRMAQNKWEIPEIPHIYERIGETPLEIILYVVFLSLNKIIDFLNFVVKFLNILVMVIQFVYTIIAVLFEYVSQVQTLQSVNSNVYIVSSLSQLDIRKTLSLSFWGGGFRVSFSLHNTHIDIYQNYENFQ